MGRSTRADDWQFAGILSLGASVGLAAGGWIFTFKSMKAAHQEDFVMLGAGLGTPGISVEVSLPSFLEGDLSWSPIVSKTAFSADDLHCSMGIIGSYGVSAGVGYSRLYATASRLIRVQDRQRGFSEVPSSQKPPEAGFSFTTTPPSLTLANVGVPRMSNIPKIPQVPQAPRFPKSSQPPSQAIGMLFESQLNDGLGVAGELKQAKNGALDVLMDASGKLGKRFKPAMNIGAMGVAGMWFGIGSVVVNAMAATGYVAVSVLSGGLVQAGEALLTGRGINVMRKFAAGYASRLADITSTESALAYDNALYNRLKNLDWKSDLITYGQKHVDNGSRAIAELDQVELAGQAAILQSVHRYVDANGEDAWYNAKLKHRSTWGELASGRENVYLKSLYRQIDACTTVGFLPANQFLP